MGSEIKLFTLDQERYNSTEKHASDLFSDYESVIKQYQEYSAYLKAYLCECLNYLNQVIALASASSST